MTSGSTDSTRTTNHWQPRTLYYWLARVGASSAFTIFIIVMLNLVCYASKLDGYFLSDDFSVINHVYRVFNGEPMLLLTNYTSRFFETEGVAFYRPILATSFAIDYLFWKANAKGFLISNLVFHILGAIGVFLVTKRLFLTDLKGQAQKMDDNDEESKSTGVRARLSPDHVYTINFASFVAAAIFSVHPLHPEVVCWISGRVDSLCTAFYLFALWLFLVSIQSNSKKISFRTRMLSLFLFALSLGSKEMAVTLPPTLVLLLLFFQTPVYGRSRSIINRVLNALKASWQYWVLLVIYLVVRTFALGFELGGYSGSISEGIVTTLIKRVVYEQSVYRIVFPLNMEVFAENARVIDILRIIYGSIIGTFVLTLLISRSKGTIIKSIVFTGMWFLLIMLPAAGVWNLSDNMECSRYTYTGSVALSILLALLICPLSRYGRTVLKRGEKRNFTLRLTQDILKGLSSVIAIALVAAFTAVTVKNSSVWSRASSEVKVLREKTYGQITKNPQKRAIALLNLPDNYKGAHMIYNGAMMRVLLAPPLSKQDVQGYLLTFEPPLYGNSDLVRASRIRRLVKQRPELDFYAWERINMDLDKLDYSSYKPESYSLNDIARTLPANSFLISPEFNFNSLDIDFVEVDVNIEKKKLKKRQKTERDEDRAQKIPFALYWMADNDYLFYRYRYLTAIAEPDRTQKTLKFHTAEHKLFLKSANIRRLGIYCPVEGYNIKVNAIRLVKASDQIPTLSVAENKRDFEDMSGHVNLNTDQNSIDITFDASRIKGATSVRAEISRQNSWFEHYSGTFRDDQFSNRVLFAKAIGKTSSKSYKLDLGPIKKSGFYEIRLAAQDDNGTMIGYFSDPIFLQVAR